MPRSHRIPTVDLETAQDIDDMQKLLDRSIRRRMLPGAKSTAIGVISSRRFFPDFDEPVLGTVEQQTDPFRAKYLDRFAPMRRLFSEEDEIWIRQNVPHFSGPVMAIRRKLMTAYADEISDDLDLLWLGKRRRAHMANNWRFVEMLVWRAEGMFLVTQLRSAVTLHSIGARHARGLADRVVRDLEAFIAAAVLENQVQLLQP